MKQIFLSIAAILGGLSVVAGAFATHSLRGQISDRILEVFEVGTRYQMYHALALLAVAILLTNKPSPNKILIVSGWLFIIGTLLSAMDRNNIMSGRIIINKTTPP